MRLAAPHGHCSRNTYNEAGGSGKAEMLEAEIKVPAVVRVDSQGQASTAAIRENEVPAAMACQDGG